MTDEGYTYVDHMQKAQRQLTGAMFADNYDLVLDGLYAARQSITRAINMLPKPPAESEDDAA